MIFKMGTILALLLSLSFSVAEARPGKHKGEHMMKLMEELNLTGEQRDRIKAERQKNRGSMKALKERTKEARNKVREAFKSNASNDVLKGLQKEVQAAQNAAMDARFESMLAIRDILTPEQRTQFNQWHEKRHGKKGRFGADTDDDEDGE